MLALFTMVVFGIGQWRKTTHVAFLLHANEMANIRITRWEKRPFIHSLLCIVRTDCSFNGKQVALLLSDSLNRLQEQQVFHQVLFVQMRGGTTIALGSGHTTRTKVASVRSTEISQRGLGRASESERERDQGGSFSQPILGIPGPIRSIVFCWNTHITVSEVCAIQLNLSLCSRFYVL